MNEVIHLRSIAQIEAEAAAWVWRLDDENVSAEDRRQFEHWQRADVRHRRAVEELGGVWNALDGLAEAKRDQRIATFVADIQRETDRNRMPSVWRRSLPLAAAAAVALGIGLTLWMSNGNEAQTLSTAVGQHRTVKLADGSIVALNTNTILETRLVNEQRVIHLKKGEALFTVARDKNRPFYVVAAGTTVRAVGTEFNVRLREHNDVEVIVSEGRVEVESKLQRLGKRQLAAGQRIDTIAEKPAVQVMNAVALDNTLAWREGAIVFDRESLADAIAELNRYTDTRFVVTQPEVRDMRIGGRFKAGDVEEFLSALKKALPVSTRWTPDNIVYIEARQ